MTEDRKPSFRDRMKPMEYLSFAAVAALFTGLVVLLTTRNWALVGIFALVAFTATLLVVAVNKDIDKKNLEAAKRAEKADGDDNAS